MCFQLEMYEEHIGGGELSTQKIFLLHRTNQQGSPKPQISKTAKLTQETVIVAIHIFSWSDFYREHSKQQYSVQQPLNKKWVLRDSLILSNSRSL